MIEINLLPEDLRKKEEVRLNLPEIQLPTFKTLIIGLVFFLAFQFLLSVFAVYQRFELSSVESRISELKGRNQDVLDLKAETASLRGRERRLEFLMNRNYRWSSLLNALVHSMTRGVWLREFSVIELNQEAKGNASGSARYLKLYGSAVGHGQEAAYIGKFIKSLKDNEEFSRLFDKIDLSNMNQRKMKDQDFYDFEISCRFKSEMNS